MYPLSGTLCTSHAPVQYHHEVPCQTSANPRPVDSLARGTKKRTTCQRRRQPKTPPLQILKPHTRPNKIQLDPISAFYPPAASCLSPRPLFVCARPRALTIMRGPGLRTLASAARTSTTRTWRAKRRARQWRWIDSARANS